MIELEKERRSVHGYKLPSTMKIKRDEHGAMDFVVVVAWKFRKLLPFSLKSSLSMFRLSLLLLLLLNASIHVQSSSPPPPPNINLEQHCVKMSSPRPESDNPVDITHVDCASCDQILLHTGQISAKCHDSQSYHKSCCANFLLMEIDDCYFEVDTALYFPSGGSDVFHRSPKRFYPSWATTTISGSPTCQRKPRKQLTAQLSTFWSGPCALSSSSMVRRKIRVR
jgi:hypothetical protein